MTDPCLTTFDRRPLEKTSPKKHESFGGRAATTSTCFRLVRALVDDCKRSYEEAKVEDANLKYVQRKEAYDLTGLG